MPLEVSEYGEMAALAVSDMAKLHLRKMGDKLAAPRFGNRTHSLGHIHNV